MEANVIKIGNSKGIIIPHELLKLMKLKDKVSINIEKNRLVIAPVKQKVREGWEEMIINEINKNGQPKQLISDIFNDEPFKEWTW